ncbi:hypothetical protein LR48_Vigan04g103000 [Vigna angularis]|uniref:Putative plant transposon protein domain-containing protein n=1 Tax=Phaseolus angularis TaxID=3914 RepID=A0A0L9UE53_PHAAN|nr:hypothetical protein LR48_Vigan04g103000 [Vigna angularis]
MAFSSGKGIKTGGNKRKEPECPYSNKFLSLIHEQHFLTVQDRRLLMERKAGWVPDLAPQFGEEVESRKWERIATYPTPENITVVKEFYTNARSLGDSPTEDYMSYVRGKIIWYGLDSINRFLHIEWTSVQCQFALNMEEGAYFEDMESVLCVPRGNFQRNRNGAAVHIRRAYMTSLAKYWMAFSYANIQPCSHVFDITVNMALFLYCVFRGMNINIGHVIASEIQTYASTMNNKAPLGHPSLITHLYELVGVNTSSPPLECPRKAIDEAYYRRIMEEMRRWTMDEFNNVVAWPKEQAQGSGVGAAEALAVEDDDDFEDVEEGEVEDSDDSMG